VSTAIDRSTPVVIFRSGHHSGLGIARSLGRLGIPVYSVDAERWESAFSSRYCRGRFIVDVRSGRPQDGIAHLLEIGHKLGGRPLLIPTTDQGTIWIADHASALRETYSFTSSDPLLIRLLSDKGRMQDLARRCGVPTAQALVPRCKRDLEQFLDTVAFPVMVKAIDAERLRRRTGGTKFVVRTHRELLSICAKAEDYDEPAFLIQEFIPGEDWMFNGYFDRRSECVFGATGKKIRRFPSSTGVTSLGICLGNQNVTRLTTEFMKAISYQGILDIGYRYDERDGQYKVLDVNPRIGCTFRLFTAISGMDVVRALYLDLTGQRVPGAAAEEGRKWIVEDFDLFSTIRLWMNHGLKWKPWLRSLSGIQESACFAWDDPLPFLIMGVADCCQFYQWMRSQRHSRIVPPRQIHAIGSTNRSAP
jgi:D-aspartate ligase